ncbi:MAG: hypothetical protein M3069_19215 [Chloroflexota bacterium]|nr:hypothetical protein [Chloroflexota bacterium]
MQDQRPTPPPAPALKKLDVTIARLRLLVAEVTAREAAQEEQRRTCRDQHNKLISFSLYGDSTLDSVLAMLADVDERLAHVEATLRSLAAIRKRAENELESLLLTKRIGEAKVLLHELQAKQAGPIDDAADALSPAEIQAEIARLRTLINEASERAAQTIATRSKT